MFSAKYESQFIELLKAVKSLGYTEGSITNSLDDDFSELSLSPLMIGKNGCPACHEIHTFFTPIYIGKDKINESHIKQYSKIVKLYNEYMVDTYENFKPMKDPVLTLIFRDVGPVTVLQSSLYVLSDNKNQLVKMSHDIAKMFILGGLNVVREKIEASIRGINGIPETSDIMKLYPKYFEFHIKVARKNKTLVCPLTDIEEGQLIKISAKFTEKFSTPVPLSYNTTKQETDGYQRYLNVRFRSVGSKDALLFVEDIKKSINNETDFEVLKTIEEYVWYDSYVKMDAGWIDF